MGFAEKAEELFGPADRRRDVATTPRLANRRVFNAMRNELLQRRRRVQLSKRHSAVAPRVQRAGAHCASIVLDHCYVQFRLDDVVGGR